MLTSKIFKQYPSLCSIQARPLFTLSGSVGALSSPIYQPKTCAKGLLQGQGIDLEYSCCTVYTFSRWPSALSQSGACHFHLYSRLSSKPISCCSIFSHLFPVITPLAELTVFSLCTNPLLLWFFCCCSYSDWFWAYLLRPGSLRQITRHCQMLSWNTWLLRSSYICKCLSLPICLSHKPAILTSFGVDIYSLLPLMWSPTTTRVHFWHSHRGLCCGIFQNFWSRGNKKDKPP